jgi:hypothetical protein
MRPSVLARSVVLVLLAAAPAGAQLRGGAPARPSGTPEWWFSGGIVAATVGTVSDGASGSTWDFSGDPRWQIRGTLEKAVQPTTTLGLAVNYGTVDFRYAPLAGAGVPDLAPETPASVAQCVSAGCTGQLDLWGAQLVLRGGGAREGLHQILEVTGGVTGFRGLRAKEDGRPLPAADAIDVNVGLGYGLGYAFDADFHVGFVQDWGIAWHRGAALPEGVGRTYRTRNSRLTIRYGFGNFR